MSITFQSDAACRTVKSREPCLCAQHAPTFPEAEAKVLAQHAYPTCPVCRGTGLWDHEKRDEPTLNVANLNAAALLDFLGVLEDPTLRRLENSIAGGSIPIPNMRRALLRARNTFARRARRYTRESSSTHDGRHHSDGLPLDRLAHYLSALERLCLVAHERGGQLITWD